MGFACGRFDDKVVVVAWFGDEVDAGVCNGACRLWHSVDVRVRWKSQHPVAYVNGEMVKARELTNQSIG